MTTRDFYGGLALTTVGLALALAALAALVTPVRTQLGFGSASAGLYALLCVAIYYTASPVAHSAKRVRLAQYVMLLTCVKMVLSIGFVLLYYYLWRPSGTSFLYPFFAAYLAYTIYETYVLLRLNRVGVQSLST